jgi:uncharacterized protein YkwD
MPNRTLTVLLLAILSGCAADTVTDGPEGDPNLADEGDRDPGAPQTTSVGEIAASGMIDSEEAAFLTLINTYRAQHGLPSLRISVAVSRASQAHASDMATQNYFAHESLDGRDFVARLGAQGYNYNTYKGENLAAGYSDARHTFEQLRDACDPDESGACTYAHRQNMLEPNFRVIGIGRAYNARSDYEWYWATDFGGEVDATFSYGNGSVLVNGAFESATLGTAGWNAVRSRGGWYTSNAQRSTSSPQSGSYQLTVNGGASAAQVVLAAPGVSYTFTTNSRRISGSGAQSIYVEALDGNYARLAIVGAAAAAASTYATASTGLVAPAGTKYVRAFVYAPASSTTRFAYDNVVLTAQ